MITEEKVQKISPQQAADDGMFGPVYHGTTADKWEKIEREGFKIFIGRERQGDVSHGYETSDYAGGIPAPIHHLGFGVYFTTSLTIAKKFNGGTIKGLKNFYLDVPRLEVINWGSQNTMMKWWIKNGYDFNVEKGYPITEKFKIKSNTRRHGNIQDERLRATINLTNELKSKYDAVWYKGKGIHQLLDGDQICVYDPKNIYEVDRKLAKPFEIGSIVIAKVGMSYSGRNTPIGTKGIITNKRDAQELKTHYPMNQAGQAANKWVLSVKWAKGGEHLQIPDTWVEPAEIYRKL